MQCYSSDIISMFVKTNFSLMTNLGLNNKLLPIICFIPTNFVDAKYLRQIASFENFYFYSIYNTFH